MKRRDAIGAMAATGILAGAGLIPMSGCGGKAEEKKVIRVTRNIGGRAGFRKHWETWKAAFEKNNPGWTMQLIDLGNADGAEYYKTRIASGDLPEIVMTWQLAGFLADSGRLVPFGEDYYQKFGIPLPPPYKGKYYTSQGGLQIQGIVVNKKMWSDAGVTQPPATWDEFIEGLKKVKAKGYTPLVYGAREWSASEPIFYGIATNMYPHKYDPAQPSWTQLRDQGKVRFASDPIARLVLEKMIYMLDNFTEKGVLSAGYNDEQRDFYSGKGAAWMMGCWIGGDLESNKVNFEIEYWPIPSMTGKPPIFLNTSSVPNGWAITTNAAGEKLEKARAALETFYDPAVYQDFLNGEYQFGLAEKLPVKKPKSSSPVVQKFLDNMEANLNKYGSTPGCHRTLTDFPPQNFLMSWTAIMQEILSGRKDIDRLLKLMDDDWDSARKGE